MAQECQDKEVKRADLVSLIEQDQVALTLKLREKPDFLRAWKHNISGYYYKGLWEKLDLDLDSNGKQINKPMNTLTRGYGFQGAGKSRVMLYHVYILREFFGFDYKNLFSQMNAGLWIVEKAYEARKSGVELIRCVLNIDEDRKMFGQGSTQENNQFDEFTEFLRQKQICIQICNPYDTSNMNTQLEVIGYTLDGFTKSILYQKTDLREGTYRPLGYVLTKMPPKNYDDAYELEKKEFMNNVVGNRSDRNLKDAKILEYTYADMPSHIKELIRTSIVLNHERDTKLLIGREIKNWNLPVRYTESLIDAFRWKYYQREIQQLYASQNARMEAKAEKSGIYNKQAEEATETIEEPIKESVLKTSSISIKRKGGIDVKKLMG